MGVYIPNMLKPKSCVECPFEIEEHGRKLCKLIYDTIDASIDDSIQKTHWCPLIEVKPHGDLIDRDVAKAHFKGEGIRVSKLSVMAVLNNAEVIIKAEPTCNDCKYSLQNCKDKSICCEMEDGLCDEYEKENC